ncbi:MAG: hypothetical protein AAFQ13_12720 [Pseudomonadota bacterium]
MSVLLAITAALSLPSVNEQTVRHLARRLDFDSEEQTGAARVTLWIDARGKVLDCQLVQFVGEEGFAKRMCEEVVGARFSAAKAKGGIHVHSMYTTTLGGSGGSVHRSGTMANWVSGRSAAADFVIQLSEVPPDLSWQKQIEVVALVEANGVVSQCESAGYAVADWTRIACEQLRQTNLEMRQSRKGELIPYLRNLVVKFEAAQ